MYGGEFAVDEDGLADYNDPRVVEELGLSHPSRPLQSLTARAREITRSKEKRPEETLKKAKRQRVFESMKQERQSAFKSFILLIKDYQKMVTKCE